MKKTKFKHLLRSVKKSGVTFFAVAFIAAVSIAIFLGFQSASNAILEETDNYFNSNNLQTLEIACANGITEDDLKAIAGWEGITAVEGGYTSSVRMNIDGERILIQARSTPLAMNTPRVLEGELPDAPNEIAIEELLATRKGLTVGQTITLEHDGELIEDSFTVTAIINEPAFCCVNVKDARGKGSVGLGSNDFYIELTKDAFDADYFEGCYTVAYADSTTLDGVFYFSEEYTAQESEYIDRLDAAAQERAALRYESLRDEVDGELADAQSELDEAAAEIADARVEIEDAENELADAEVTIADARVELADAESALADAKGMLDTQLAALGLPTDYDEAMSALAAFGAAGEPMRSAIESYRSGEAALDTARDALAEGEAEYEQGKADLAEAKAELADAEADYAEAESELADARVEAADIREEKWVVSGRNDMGDVRGVQTIVDMLTGLSYAMSVIFLLVSAVICYAAATRMIDEQRTLIGAQKALGLTPGEIMAHYMTYNLVCAALGIILGWILGVVIVENLVIYVFTVEFLLGSIELSFSWSSAVIAGGICLVIFGGASWITCSKLAKQPAIQLLRGELPSYGKARFFEKWGAYKKLSLYSRSMVKNVLSDKGRMFTTIMGVVGCVALLVSCITMKRGIENSSIRQFDEYFTYTHRLVVDTTVAETDDFAAVLDEHGTANTLVHDKLENFRVDGGQWENAHLIAISEPGEIGEFMRIEDTSSGDEISVPERGVLVSRRCAEQYDLVVGSVVEFMDDKGSPRSFEVAGVIEHYLNYHLFVCSDAYFEEAMGRETDPSVFLVKNNIDGLVDKVGGMDGYLSLADNSAFAANADVHSLVIAICTALSAALALLVLLNQIAMHINRKSRELAVMRINGYTLKETKAYIYKDNIVLTALGLVLGSGFGIALGYLNIRIIETGACRYVRDPNFFAIGVACGIVALFAVIVNIIALKRVDKLNLTNVSSN